MAQVATRHDAYLADFERLQRTSRLPAAVARLRERAFDRFATLGFPTTRQEEWRFTNVAPIAQAAFRLAEGRGPLTPALSPVGGEGGRRPGEGVLERVALKGIKSSQLVFVNGRYAPALSSLTALPSAVGAGSLADALTAGAGLESAFGQLARIDGQPFTALNTAFLEDGAFVRIPANLVLDAPIHLVFVSTAADAPTVSHPRVLLQVGANSQAHIVESYLGVGSARYFTNGVTEMALEENAVMDHYKLLRESPEAFHVASLHLRLGRNVNFSSHSITLGGLLVRNEIDAVLDGEGIDCTLNGLYLANGQRLVDNRTTIDHAKPHCASHELYKGILDDRARAVFNGKIIVRIDAQKTDAKQTNKALLLSEDAQINTKPQLEIFADDVKCTHGATVGQLDEDALFYLRSRGLPLERARSVLIHGFASDLLNRITIAPIRAQLDRVLLEHLPGSDGETFYEQPD